MANIISQSFFVGDINIPNTGAIPVAGRINDYIVKFEPECLQKLFGYPFYKLFGSESSQRMTDVMDGAEYYDYEGVLQKWRGLVYDTSNSLIAYYVFYFLLRDSYSQLSGNGTIVSNKSDGTVTMNPQEKLINSWNVFSDQSCELLHFLWSKKDSVYNQRVYPEFSEFQYRKSLMFSRRINSFGF